MKKNKKWNSLFSTHVARIIDSFYLAVAVPKEFEADIWNVVGFDNKWLYSKGRMKGVFYQKIVGEIWISEMNWQQVKTEREQKATETR